MYDIIAVCKFGANDGTIHRKNILMQGSGMLAITLFLPPPPQLYQMVIELPFIQFGVGKHGNCFSLLSH